MRNSDVQKILSQLPDDTEVVVFRQGSRAVPARPYVVAISPRGERYLDSADSTLEADETLALAFHTAPHRS